MALVSLARPSMATRLASPTQAMLLASGLWSGAMWRPAVVKAVLSAAESGASMGCCSALLLAQHSGSCSALLSALLSELLSAALMAHLCASRSLHSAAVSGVQLAHPMAPLWVIGSVQQSVASVVGL